MHSSTLLLIEQRCMKCDFGALRSSFSLSLSDRLCISTSPGDSGLSRGTDVTFGHISSQTHLARNHLANTQETTSHMGSERLADDSLAGLCETFMMDCSALEASAKVGSTWQLLANKTTSRDETMFCSYILWQSTAGLALWPSCSGLAPSGLSALWWFCTYGLQEIADFETHGNDVTFSHISPQTHQTRQQLVNAEETTRVGIQNVEELSTY
mmetsp:Transcript_52132/g.121647  ORF Transcript_52132/g.121647 Transcript_52132/m.121647 type:complete len:212 (+) Transcript_52132:120-755(+)